MNEGVDVGQLYVEISDLTDVLLEIQQKETWLMGIEENIRKLIDGKKYKIPMEIDLLNGSTLIIKEDVMFLEVSNEE